MMAPRVTVEECGHALEVTVYDGGVGLSVVVTPGQWAAIVAQGEQLEPVRAYRRAEHVLAASHRARR